MSLTQEWGEVRLMVSLRDLRAERLLSIRELARRASVAPSTIFLIETGRSVPRQRVARQIAKVLAVDPREVDELRRRIEVSKSRKRPPLVTDQSAGLPHAGPPPS